MHACALMILLSSATSCPKGYSCAQEASSGPIVQQYSRDDVHAHSFLPISFLCVLSNQFGIMYETRDFWLGATADV